MTYPPQVASVDVAMRIEYEHEPPLSEKKFQEEITLHKQARAEARARAHPAAPPRPSLASKMISNGWMSPPKGNRGGLEDSKRKPSLNLQSPRAGGRAGTRAGKAPVPVPAPVPARFTSMSTPGHESPVGFVRRRSLSESVAGAAAEAGVWGEHAPLARTNPRHLASSPLMQDLLVSAGASHGHTRASTTGKPPPPGTGGSESESEAHDGAGKAQSLLDLGARGGRGVAGRRAGNTSSPRTPTITGTIEGAAARAATVAPLVRPTPMRGKATTPPSRGQLMGLRDLQMRYMTCVRQLIAAALEASATKSNLSLRARQAVLLFERHSHSPAPSDAPARGDAETEHRTASTPGSGGGAAEGAAIPAATATQTAAAAANGTAATAAHADVASPPNEFGSPINVWDPAGAKQMRLWQLAMLPSADRCRVFAAALATTASAADPGGEPWAATPNAADSFEDAVSTLRLCTSPRAYDALWAKQDEAFQDLWSASEEEMFLKEELAKKASRLLEVQKSLAAQQLLHSIRKLEAKAGSGDPLHGASSDQRAVHQHVSDHETLLVEVGQVRKIQAANDARHAAELAERHRLRNQQTQWLLAMRAEVAGFVNRGVSEGADAERRGTGDTGASSAEPVTGFEFDCLDFGGGGDGGTRTQPRPDTLAATRTKQASHGSAALATDERVTGVDFDCLDFGAGGLSAVLQNDILMNPPELATLEELLKEYFHVVRAWAFMSEVLDYVKKGGASLGEAPLRTGQKKAAVHLAASRIYVSCIHATHAPSVALQLFVPGRKKPPSRDPPNQCLQNIFKRGENQVTTVLRASGVEPCLCIVLLFAGPR